MTTLHFVKKARKDIPEAGIKKGDSYYWWQFAFGRKQASKEHPRRSRYMTQSPYLSQIYDIEDDMAALTVSDVNENCLDEFTSAIENIIDEAQSSLDNIPDQLKDASAGAQLQEYIENLEQWQSDLEGIDLDNTDDGDFDDEAQSEWDSLSKKEQMNNLKDITEEEWVERRASELLEERRQEALDEIQSTSYPG